MGRRSLMVDVWHVQSDLTMITLTPRPNSAKICLQLPQGDTKLSLQKCIVVCTNGRHSELKIMLLSYCTLRTANFIAQLYV